MKTDVYISLLFTTFWRREWDSNPRVPKDISWHVHEFILISRLTPFRAIDLPSSGIPANILDKALQFNVFFIEYSHIIHTNRLYKCYMAKYESCESFFRKLKKCYAEVKPSSRYANPLGTWRWGGCPICMSGNGYQLSSTWYTRIFFTRQLVKIVSTSFKLHNAFRIWTEIVNTTFSW